MAAGDSFLALEIELIEFDNSPALWYIDHQLDMQRQ